MMKENLQIEGGTKKSEENKISGKDNDFISENLNKWFHFKGKDLLNKVDIYTIEDIDIAHENITWAIEDLVKKKKNIYQFWQEKYSHISEEAFLPFWYFSQGDEELMAKFEKISQIIEDNELKEKLELNILKNLNLNKNIFNFLVSNFKKIDFEKKENIKPFINVLEKTNAYTDFHKRITDYFYRQYSAETQKVSEDIVFSKKENIANLENLENTIQKGIEEKIEKIRYHYSEDNQMFEGDQFLLNFFLQDIKKNELLGKAILVDCVENEKTLIDENVLFMKETLQYEGLLFFLKNLKTKEEKEKFFFQTVKINLEKEINELLKHEHYTQAQYLVESADVVGQEIEQKKKNLIAMENYKNQRIKEKREKLRESYREKEAEYYIDQEMILFYTWMAIDSEKKQLNWELENQDQELNFSFNLKLEELNEKQEQAVQRLFQFLRQYLVVAVNSELKYQDDYSYNIYRLRLPSQYKNSVDEFLTKASQEEIREYLHRADFQFTLFTQEEPSGEYLYGGYPWANIANLAEEMWKDNLETDKKQELIDRAFQIQHNNGFVFNKDNKVRYCSTYAHIEIEYGENNLTEILDVKRGDKDKYPQAAKNIDELVEYFVNEYIPRRLSEITQKKRYENLKIKISSLVSLWKEVKSKQEKLRRRKGTD